MVHSSYKLYDLEAKSVVSGMRVADCMSYSNVEAPDEMSDGEILTKMKNLTVSNIMNCSVCNVSFSDATDQRNHFKLDWHRYNLKRMLCNRQSVTEDVFDGIAEEVSSISASDSENSLKGFNDNESNCSMKKDISQRHERTRHSKAFFENSDNKIFSVYKCLLHSRKETPSNALLISSTLDLINGSKKWLIVMLGGGHFAAAIYNDGIVAEHKTFHCYTVRAKQGGSQSSRDNRGGSHPKSAGASLRRFNEQALVQHVQDILSGWSDSIKQCQLILYRATGPYNRGVLFGGKNPPLEKSDSRLRNIPFPTRRATYNEIKRVHDILSTLEIHGDSIDFKDKFPKSPDKRSSRKDDGKSGNVLQNPESGINETVKKKKIIRQSIDRSKIRCSPQREIPGEIINAAAEIVTSESEDDTGQLLTEMYIDISLNNLREFEDTVPEYVKEQKKKCEKIGHSKQRKKLVKSAFERKFETIQRKLLHSCEREDINLLMDTLNIYNSLPERIDESCCEDNVMTKKDFINCLNSSISNDKVKNTVLHISALKCLPNFITVLLEAGADPTVINKNRLTPYVLSGNKETKNSFKNFVSQFPNKFDLKKAKIPEPITEEIKKLQDEKRREKVKLKREKEKLKRKENKEKRTEEKERERFLALSDREKRALAAERRIVASMTENLKSAKPPVLSRCFQCGLDITGKVPYEYGMNRFCSIPCVKSHRTKTKSFGVEI